jgi:hypothetical protein
VGNELNDILYIIAAKNQQNAKKCPGENRDRQKAPVRYKGKKILPAIWLQRTATD